MSKRYGKARTARNKLVNRIRRKHESTPGFLGVSLSLELTTSDGTVRTLGPGALFMHPVGSAPEPAPVNPSTGEPYFKVPQDGWGTGWSAGPSTPVDPP